MAEIVQKCKISVQTAPNCPEWFDKIIQSITLDYLKNKFQLVSEFLERDSDITYQEEFNYIFITLKETLKIVLKLK